MKSVLITGGSGSFGTAFVERLLNEGIKRVCVYSRSEHRHAEMRRTFDDHSALRFFIGDVRDRQRLETAMQGCDVVVHAAALKRIEVGFYDPMEMVKTNVIGAMNVVEASRAALIKKVVFLSTDKAFQPISPYGQSKALAESIAVAANHLAGTRYACIRYGNVWRSAGSVVPFWENILRSGERTVPVTDPSCTRFFMRMSEACKLVFDTIETMKGGELNIPDLPAYRLGDLACAMGARMNVQGLPRWEKLHESMSEGRCSETARRMTVDELRAEL